MYTFQVLGCNSLSFSRNGLLKIDRDPPCYDQVRKFQNLDIHIFPQKQATVLFIEILGNWDPDFQIQASKIM